jgi:hypothetical protein
MDTVLKMAPAPRLAAGRASALKPRKSTIASAFDLHQS